MNFTEAYVAKPEVAVIICCFSESSEQISRAILSVIGQRDVTYSLYVADDSGTEQYRDLVTKDFPSVHYLPVSFRNNAKALNFAISNSNSEFVAILDGDDVWIDSLKLRSQVDFLAANLGTNAVGTWCEVKLPNDTVVEFCPVLTSGEIQANLLRTNPICHSSLLVRRAALNQLASQRQNNEVPGPYDSNLSRGKDIDLLLRLTSIGGLNVLPRMGVRYSVNQTGKRFSDATCGMRMTLLHRSRFEMWYMSFLFHFRRALVFYFFEKLFQRK
ncbi:Putative glycosyltransferase EpsE [Curvibacter sp. AEP1-3]|uniref:glycosyltransferase family 2 protein n=1 Tax=Curvibacter sp. AEP1-3 TaxID=1844971 RepID=UPI000B3C2C5B|nr:glycosyltransferase family 2 protein [Curvibacter sp. AEP1-3]ARV20030.1 Putative glycosyltransferase EpsE [Curvibacter sp. AEP1-3]